jgi:hypothetical protein
VDDPRIVLNGDGTGLLFATGLHTPGAPGSDPVAYDDSAAVWALDLDGGTSPLSPFRAYPAAKWQLHADGSQSLSGIVPMIETAEHVFPSNYAEGAGPDRAPNIFGSFAVRVVPASGPPGEPGAPGAAGSPGSIGPQGLTGASGAPGGVGPAGPRGRRGPRGKRGPAGKVKKVRAGQVVRLRRAPFAGRVTRKVRVTQAGRRVAVGSVRGRTLRLRLDGRRVRGVVVLRPRAGAAAAFRPVRVRIG